MGVFSKISGLNELVSLFGTKPASNFILLKKQTIKIGKVRYRRCVNVGTLESGIYLEIDPSFGKKSCILIPWQMINRVEPSKLCGLPAMTLLIGKEKQFRIGLYRTLFHDIESRTPFRVPAFQ